MNAPDPRLPRIPSDHLALVIVLGALAVAAIAWLVPETWGAYYALRLWLPVWCFAALIHGGARLDDRSRWVARLTRLSRSRWSAWGGGAYAAIAFACFGWLEWARFHEFVQALLALTDAPAVRDFVRHLFDFGLDSFLNGVYAVAWPAFWKKTFSAGQMWPAAAVAWGVFECARYAVHQLATVPEERP